MNDETNDNLESRLQSLSGSFANDPAFVQRVLGQIAAEGAAPGYSHSTQLKRWIMRGSIGLAASILAGAIAWTMFFNSPRRAYAVEDMSQQIRSLNSIHLKGLIYAPDGSTQPMELYGQQPDKVRINGDIDSGPDGPKITDVIITAENRITLDRTNKIATIAPQNPQDVKYKVAQFIQNELQMLFGPAQTFTLLRSGKVGDIQADLYRCQIDPTSRVEVWFNPATGLPVKSSLLHQYKPGKPYQPMVEFDTIEANPTFDPSIFEAQIPPDYTIVRPKLDDAHPWESTTLPGNLELDLRYEIALDKGDVLFCWRLFDQQHPGDDLKLDDAGQFVRIESMSGMAYAEHPLHADAAADGSHWRWSLLRPQTPTDGAATFLSVSPQRKNVSNSRSTFLPITFSPKDLAEQIAILQRQTLPADQTPMTLEQIEKAAGE